MINALVMDFPARPLTAHSPKTIREKYSAGPKRSAKSDRGSDRNTSPISAINPATKEPIAAMARAEPAFPCRAIW